MATAASAEFRTVAELVSSKYSIGRAVLPAGADVSAEVIDIESPAAPKNETVTTAEVAV